ncbi:hypothetical protein [Rheinheimera tangshanensis]|uniref:Lipoprotein n=1 Tax=Rheinheimera tangshanensis TaxID=400153 RepID=A0A5C8LUH3_9GAMM|nr:hypothetical protein [Rheinheimera tangshanensis]TXK79228.1 hypothetical protein FU839_15145 [Rheinheimera tangshanensis]GGM68332.1 hypothetical protein GCM10010920_31620 [Rheinheimera tangshanensis]
MKKFYLLLTLLFSLSCFAESCSISDKEVKRLSEKNRDYFTFVFTNVSNKIAIEIKAPRTLEDKDLDNIFLIGRNNLSEEIDWAIPIAMYPISTDESHVTTEMLLPNEVTKHAFFSISYGKGECLPYMQYKLSQLKK